MLKYPYSPESFSGQKFAARYELNSLDDFWADDKFIYVRGGVRLPDDPPIFEPPDPPGPKLMSKIEALPNSPVKEILRELAKNREG